MTDFWGSIIQGTLNGFGTGLGLWILGRHVTKKLEKIEDTILMKQKKQNDQTVTGVVSERH
jgi:hypothetical protein